MVRVDALMPSPSSTTRRENNHTQQKERTEEQLQEDEGQSNAADAEDPLRKAKSGDDAKKIRRKKNERNESTNGDTRYDEWYEGGGCGLVLDATLGRVVTNAHVVGDAQKVQSYIYRWSNVHRRRERCGSNRRYCAFEVEFEAFARVAEM